MPRILHIYRTYFPETQGGVQEAIRQIAVASASEGYTSTIFTLARDPKPHIITAPEGMVLRARALFEVASCDFGGPAAISRCRAAAQEADLIHMHYPWPFADLMLPLIRRPRQPLLVTYHSDIVRQVLFDKLYAPLRKRLLDAADGIVATSPNYARSSPVLANYAQKTHYIPLALPPAPASDPALREHWQQRLGRDFFLFVGVLRYYKGLPYLIDAASRTQQPIVIVGDGPLRNELMAQAAALGVSNVHFLGSLPDADKLALLDLCMGVVFPSHLRSEAFGITLLEGARAGKPLISCEIGSGTSWVNLHAETGLVVPPADPAALAEAMDQLAGDTALRQRLGENARIRWQTHFNLQDMGKAYARLYDELLARAQST